MDVSHHNGEVADMSEKLEKSLTMETDDRMEAYHRFIQDGKHAARNGDLHKALDFFKLAYNIHQSQKLESRIKKTEEFLSHNDSEEDEDEEFVNINGSGLMLFKELHDKLYDYQRDGVAFLYSLYRDGRKGGILADDMGLGKTIQVISFLSGMYDSELVKHTLLVMPTSLITNWTKEFAKWTPGMRVKEFHGTSKGERTRSLEKVQRRGGVIITTYTMLINNWQQLASHHDKEFTWDYMILDEAHKIKSTSTKTAKSANAIPSKQRVLLTGTPVQNNLREMWALFHFACQGSLLGTAKTFKAEYENPITRAREKDATPGEKALGCRMSENLMAIIKPYFLRRTKSEVQKRNSSVRPVREDEPSTQTLVPNPPGEPGAAMPALTRKNDLIVWTYLSPVQEEIYRQFISLDHIKDLLMTSRSPLAELTVLKKLCDHPRLLSAGAMAQLGLEERPQGGAADPDSHAIADVPDHALISESGKLVFLFALLERLRRDGHRTLVFARYRKVLDIMERVLRSRGFGLLRLDGTVTHIAERERLISLFQRDQRYSVFLLTTQVGGVGITLTAASRVVIYDPSWNPATDAQAVDRAYRIGQTENVVIYRLITCGTVEEKIYRRQVFKDSLIRQNTGDKKNPFRYFSKQELKELFTLEDPRSSSTQLQLQALHARHRRTDPELDEHIAHLHAMEMFGISDHDLLFSLDVNHDEALEDQEQHHYIEGRVQKAQELMKAESELQVQLTENMASSTEPAWSRERSQERRSNCTVDQDQEGSPRRRSPQVIDLTADESEERAAAEVSRDEPREPNPRPAAQDPPTHEVMEESMVSDTSEAAGEARGQQPDFASPHEGPGVTPLQNRRSSFEADASSRLSAAVESFQGNFNLQLEDSDMFSDADAEEQLLARLQVEGSFDVSRSLSELQHSRVLGGSLGGAAASEVDESADASVVASRRKRAAVIYDSEEDERPAMRSPPGNSFQALGASTPKSAASGSRRSVGGNTSVASRRSLRQSIIKDLDNQEVSDETHSEEEEEEEEDAIGHEEELQLEETTGGTLNTEEEEMSSNLELSTGEPELASTERMEPCTAAPGAAEATDGYDSLVSSGRESYSQGKLDEALGFFLRAIDLQPGDPEVQLMTIQLYRQLSQRR